jgi:hypothetical protein
VSQPESSEQQPGMLAGQTGSSGPPGIIIGELNDAGWDAR